jgi:hypothetical protein
MDLKRINIVEQHLITPLAFVESFVMPSWEQISQPGGRGIMTMKIPEFQ